MKLEELVGKKLTEAQFDEAAGEKDACYHKVKARYDVWPSAYASGALVKCRKVGAANWGNKSKKNEEVELKNPKKADLNKDGKLSSYEKARGKGIEKAMGISEYDVEDGQDVKEFIEFMRENYLNTLEEAEYKGRKVKLNKPMQGDTKKFKVYVNTGKKNADGTIKVKKVNFGQKGMVIKKDNPARRKSFRARHKCDQKKDKTTAGYWSCRKW